MRTPHVLAPLILSGLLVSAAQAQKPIIRYIFPAGAQRGTTADITLYGTGLQNASVARITPGDVTAVIKRATSQDQATLTLTVPSNAPLGERVVRLVTPGGITNQFRFLVGQLPEIRKDLNNTTPQSAQLLSKLPVLVNGQVEEGRRDYYRFTCKAGQSLVCSADARAMLPYIADAVPGWLDVCLTLFDPQGKRIGSVDDFRFSPDPTLACRIPTDGEYILEVRDILDRGRADFVYRLSVGELPWITSIFPMGARKGGSQAVKLEGANLPSSSITVATSQDPLAQVAVSAGGLESNRRPFAAGDTPEKEEQEPNDAPSAANRVEAPVTINGRIDRPGDVDCFTFRAARQQTLVMEVFARRLDSPVDSLLTLLAANGGRLAENDDTVDPGESLLTHHADSRFHYTFPADGDYTLRIRDNQGGGGPEYGYRISVAPPVPDFALRMTPDAPLIAMGDSAIVTVTPQRRDGFGGEIELSVGNLPPGFTASGGVIAGGDPNASLTITAPPQTAVPCFAPVIVGTAKIGTTTVSRVAVANEQVMQAFSLTFYPVTREMLCGVMPGGGFTLAEAAPRPGPIEIKAGGEARVAVKVTRAAGIVGPVALRPAAPAPGVEIVPATVPDGADTAEVILRVAANAAPGSRPNVILQGILQAGANTIARTLPAIPVRILSAK